MTVVSTHTATTVAVDAADLKAALAKIKPAVAKHGTPVLYNIRVDATSNEIRLTASNLDDTLSTTIAGIVTEPGAVLVPYALLNKLLLAHKKGTVEIIGGQTEASVRCKNLSLAFEPHALDEWPQIDPAKQQGAGRKITLNLDAITDISAALSKDEYRPILCSVLVRNGVYVTTDSYRLHLVETTNDTGDGFLLQRSGALIATKYKGAVAATVYERDIVIELDDTTTLTARLVEGEFPLYNNLIPKNPPCRLELSPSFLDDCKTLIKVSTGDPSAPLKVSQGDGELNVKIAGGDSPWKGTVTTPGSIDDNMDGIGFNPNYLVDMLAGTNSLLLQGVDRLKPVVLRDPAPELGDGACRVRLIMPVRIG